MSWTSGNEFRCIIRDLLVAFEKNIPSLITSNTDKLRKIWKENELAVFSKSEENLFVEVATILSLIEIESRDTNPPYSIRSLYTKQLKDVFGESSILSDYCK